MAPFPIQRSRHAVSPHSSSLFLKRLATAALPLALLLLLLSSSAGCGLTDPLDVEFGKPDPEDLKVLFIGSSYLAVNDMPGIFQGLAEAAGKDVFVAGRVPDGGVPGHSPSNQE